MSELPLTGYDNRDTRTGVRDDEVFLYDAEAGGGAGKLICASCNPSGGRPVGVYDEGTFEKGLKVDPGGGGDVGLTLAAVTPYWIDNGQQEELYDPRYLSDSGRLLFDAADSLVPQDSNGAFDVYEFEFPRGPGQPASDNCTVGGPDFSSSSGGCVSLISSGTSPEESVFLDASDSGDDVFFTTESSLAPKDIDGAVDVYDARIDGGEPQTIRPVECAGDACQPSVTPPNDLSPGSFTFNGAGNLTQPSAEKKSTSCSKRKALRRGKCVRRKIKKRQVKRNHKKHGNKTKGGKSAKRPGRGGQK
jgi:hypothetical protein